MVDVDRLDGPVDGPVDGPESIHFTIVLRHTLHVRVECK